MLDTIGGFVRAGVGALVLGAIVFMLFLGVVGPAWEGTKCARKDFWVIFLPCLAFMMLVSFGIGKFFS